MSDCNLRGLPSPSESQTHGSTSEQPAGSAGGSQRRRVRSVDECLFALEQLAGLVALGLMTPARANAIRGALRDIIAVQQRAAGGSAAAPIDHDVMERLRQDPQLMNLMAPLLTKEQIAALMQETPDGDSQQET